MPTRRLVLIATITALFLALPATALAQSGTPGTDNAAEGVYDGGEVLGPPTTPQSPPGDTPDDSDAPGGGTVAGPDEGGDDQSVPFAASNGGDDGDSGVGSLPFTGFYAVLVIALALVLLSAGMIVRRASRSRSSEG